MSEWIVTDGTHSFPFPLEKLQNVNTNIVSTNFLQLNTLKELVDNIQAIDLFVEQKTIEDMLSEGERLLKKVKALDADMRARFLVSKNDKKSVMKLGVEAHYKLSEANRQYKALPENDEEIRNLLISFAKFVVVDLFEYDGETLPQVVERYVS